MLAMAMAQTTTLQIPFYGYDNFPIDASVIAVQDSVTTLTLACPSNADECGLFPQQTLTYGPSTYRMDTGDGDAFTGFQVCEVSVCTESAGGSEANFPGSSMTTYDGVETMPVTVTGGVSLLTGGAGSATATPSPSTGATASETMASVTQLSGTAMSSSETGSASQTQSAAALTSSGAASRSNTMLSGSLIGGMMGLLGLLC